MTIPRRSPWHVVLPVKGGPAAKSRLHPPAGASRADLARAFALDTLGAVADAVPAAQVLVVTSDPVVAAEAGAAGCIVLPDPGHGLLAAVEAGLQRLRQAAGSPPSAVLLGDLPALRGADLAEALAHARPHRSAFVPDAAGTGTVLLTGRTAADLVPRFGTGSAAAHSEQSRRLDLDLPRLRTDVDDDAGLAAARALGPGPHTRRALRGAATLGPCRPRSTASTMPPGRAAC